MDGLEALDVIRTLEDKLPSSQREYNKVVEAYTVLDRQEEIGRYDFMIARKSGCVSEHSME